MKSLIRSLNIQERKTIVYSTSFTFFNILFILLVKILGITLNINSVTILCETGCILSIICLFRMIILFKNKKSKREETMDMRNFKNILLKATVGCLSLTFAIYTICESSLSDFFVIMRMWPIFTLFFFQLLFNIQMEGYRILGAVIDLFAVLLILFPLLETKSTLGLMGALFFTLLNSLSDILARQLQRTNTDLLILFIGVFSSAFGSFLMITTSSQIDEIYFYHWLTIFLIAVFAYYSILFQTKVVKSLDKINIIYPLSIISIFFSFLFDWVIFDKSPFKNEIIGIIILILSTIFYSSNIIKRLRKQKSSFDEDCEVEKTKDYTYYT